MKRLPALATTVLALSCLASVCLPARAALTEGKTYKNMPWHLADIWWSLPAESVTDDFQTLEVDVTIVGKLDDSLRLYIAPFGLGSLSGTKFYGGIQTHMAAQTKTNPNRQNIGRGGIFSMWGERDLDAIRTAEGGFMESSGHEGDFISIRRKLNWSQGTYTCRLEVAEQVTIDEKPYTWVRYSIHDHQTNRQVDCGSLRFPNHHLKLGKSVAGFVEIFGRKPDQHVIPQDLTITFSAPRVNGNTPAKPGCRAIYPKGVPDVVRAAPAIASTPSATDTRAVVFTFSKDEFVREKRQHPLYQPGK